MSAILFAAWAFSVVSFSIVGVTCRIVCRRRRSRGGGCICGRHVAGVRAVGTGRREVLATGHSKLRAAETKVRALQQRYIEGRLSMEQYELEVDRLVGLA